MSGRAEGGAAAARPAAPATSDGGGRPAKPPARGFRALLALLAAVTLLFAPLLHKAIFLSRGTDYPAHLRFAARMWAEREPVTPHFLYQLEVLLLDGLLGGPAGDYKLAGAVASLINLGLLGAVLLFYLRRELAGRGAEWRQRPGTLDRTAVACALAAMLVTPIPLLYGWDHLKYLGYIGITVYHNPTMLVLKPLALLLFWVASELVLVREEKVSAGRLLALAGLIVACALAKPSYLIAFLPGLVLYAVGARLRGAAPSLALVALGIVLPALLVLGWQYWSYYPESGKMLVLAPLAAKLHHSGYLLPKLLLSIAFPAAVYLSFFSRARRDRRLNLAWLVFAFGAGYAYLFAETVRAGSSNFDWSAQAALFVLFVQSLAFLAGRPGAGGGPGAGSWRTALCWCVFALHLASGLFYLAHIYFLSPPGRFVYI